jgi:hypothetical protein
MKRGIRRSPDLWEPAKSLAERRARDSCALAWASLLRPAMASLFSKLRIGAVLAEEQVGNAPNAEFYDAVVTKADDRRVHVIGACSRRKADAAKQRSGAPSVPVCRGAIIGRSE